MFKQLTISTAVAAALLTPVVASAASPGWRVQIDPDTGKMIVPDHASQAKPNTYRADGLMKLPERAEAKLPGSEQPAVRPGPIGGTLITPPDYMRSDLKVHVNDEGDLVAGGSTMTFNSSISSNIMRAGVVTAMAVFAASTCWAGQARVNNDDPHGLGYNNSAPREPEGGNGGTTLGEQRLRATRFAANLLASKIDSDVTLVVSGQADPNMSCTSTVATLASAGPTLIYTDFEGAPLQDTLYPIGLANAIAGNDLIPADNADGNASSDIILRFNPFIGLNNDCLGGRDFYYGLDGETPDGTINFVNVITHEMTHGLGFLSSADPYTGGFTGSGFPSVFDRHIQDLDLDTTWAQASAAERAMSATNTGRLVFVGDATDQGGLDLLTGGLVDGHVRLFAPKRVASGSSVGHWGTEVSPDQIMEPYNTGATNATQGVGLTSCALSDIGWTLEQDTPCPDDTTYAPALVGEPSALSFDPVGTDDKQSMSVTIRNRGGKAVSVDDVSIDGRSFMVTQNRCAEEAIDALDTCTIQVTFNPTTTGQKATTMQVAYSGNTILPVDLSGKAVEASEGDSANSGGSYDGGDDDGGSSGGGCAMASTDQPFDPMWLVLLTGAIGTLLFRTRSSSAA